jgi:hypothetical protein
MTKDLMFQDNMTKDHVSRQYDQTPSVQPNWTKTTGITFPDNMFPANLTID